MIPDQQFYLHLTRRAHIDKLPCVVLQEKSAGLEASMYTPELILLCLFSVSISIGLSTAWLCWVLLNESHTKVQWAKVFKVLFWDQWSVHNNLLNTFQEQNWVVVENGTVISKFLLLFYYGFRENVYISELKMKNCKCNT